MNFEQLQYVIAVTKEGSILRAADKLFVSQSAISQGISSLETELGITIFNRSRTGSLLTKPGKNVMYIASEIMDKVKELKDLEKKTYSTLTGNLKISMSNFGLMSFLPDVLLSFKNKFPNVTLDINEAQMESVLEEVLSSTSDIGFVLVNKPLLHDLENQFNCQLLFQSKIMICVSKNSPLAYKDVLTPEEIIKYPWVLNNKMLTESYKNTIPEFGIAEILFYSNNTNLIRGAVANNSALTIFTELTIKLNPFISQEGIVAIPFVANNQIQNMYFVVIQSKKKYLTVLEKEFINCINVHILKLD